MKAERAATGEKRGNTDFLKWKLRPLAKGTCPEAQGLTPEGTSTLRRLPPGGPSASFWLADWLPTCADWLPTCSSRLRERDAARLQMGTVCTASAISRPLYFTRASCWLEVAELIARSG